MRADSARIKPVMSGEVVSHYIITVIDNVAREIVEIEISKGNLEMLRYQISELLGPEVDKGHVY
jgi:hypothetical protein